MTSSLKLASFRRAAIGLCLFVTLWAVCGSISLARPACPESAGIEKPLLESAYQYRDREGDVVIDGPTFVTPSYLWHMGTWFKMPLGYQNPWPPKESALALTDLDEYKRVLAKRLTSGFDPKTDMYNTDLVTEHGGDPSFAFWMPSLRYVERNTSIVPSLRPCEAGRARPTQDDYVVEFRIRWPFLPGSEDSEATRIFRKAQERLREEGRLLFQGSNIFEHSLDGPISGNKDYQIYDDDGDLAVQLTCTVLWGNRKAPNPLCRGDVWQRSSGLVLFIKFPADQGQVGEEQRWREPVMAAIGLAKKWRWEVPAKPAD